MSCYLTQQTEDLETYPGCGHSFNRAALKKWVETHKPACPQCLSEGKYCYLTKKTNDLQIIPGCHHVVNRTALAKWIKQHDEDDACPQCFDEEEEAYLHGSDSPGSLEDFVVEDDGMESQSSLSYSTPLISEDENIGELLEEANNFVRRGVYQPATSEKEEDCSDETETTEHTNITIPDKKYLLRAIQEAHDREIGQIGPVPMVRT